MQNERPNEAERAKNEERLNKEMEDWSPKTPKRINVVTGEFIKDGRYASNPGRCPMRLRRAGYCRACGSVHRGKPNAVKPNRRRAAAASAAPPTSLEDLLS